MRPVRPLRRQSRLGEPVPAAVDEVEFDAPAASVAGQGERILLVIREGSRLSLMGNALASQGYRPELAFDGAAALRHWAESGAVDALVVDSRIELFPAEVLLTTMHESGYDGPAIVIEDGQASFDAAQVPASMPVWRLSRPLEMHRLFEAVEAVLRDRR